MLGVAVVGGAQVHAVVGLGHLYGALPLPTRLVELIQQVVTPAGAVQALSLLLRDQAPERKSESMRDRGRETFI